MRLFFSYIKAEKLNNLLPR